MARITITIATDASAFDNSEGEEVARILRALAEHLEDILILSYRDTKAIMDVNGNRAGTLKIVAGI